MKPQVQIRKAEVADADRIAHIHVDSWRTTYAGIIHQSYLNHLSYEQRKQGCLQGIQNPENAYFVALLDEQVIGFSIAGKNREPNVNADGEVYAIYLGKQHQGIGAGKLLLEAAFNALRMRGYRSCMISVLSGNHPSIAFYQNRGGRMIGHDHVDLEGHRYPTDTYLWDL